MAMTKEEALAKFRQQNTLLAQVDKGREDAEEAEQVNEIVTEAEKVAEVAPLIKGPFVDNGNGTFDCVLAHPVHGAIPFTADPNDVEEHGRLISTHVSKQRLSKKATPLASPLGGNDVGEQPQ